MNGRSLPLRAVAALAAALLGCGQKYAAPEPVGPCDQVSLPAQPSLRPVVLILADTLRRDRIGPYGGPARTPHLDAFAETGTTFDSVWSQAPWTKPSVATLFTGFYPSQHGVLSHPDLREQPGETVPEIDSDVLDDRFETLAETLQAAGYDTAAFVSNPWLLPELGFAQGFASYDHRHASNDVVGTTVSAAALDWLRAREASGTQRPFFLYVHYMDSHSPYAPISERDLAERRAAIEADTRKVDRETARLIANVSLDEHGHQVAARGIPANVALMELTYDEGVQQLDVAVGALLDGLAASPLARDAAVIFLSDHGEALFTRGYVGHGHGLYAASTAVPLLAHLPGVDAPARVSCPLGLVDVRASLCDYLGLPCAGSDAGHSIFDRSAPRHWIVSEGVIGKPRNRVLRGRHWTLVSQPDGRASPRAPQDRLLSLFFREGDPLELHELDPARTRGEATVAEQTLAAALPGAVPTAEGESPRRVKLDENTRRRLQALGYVDGAPTAQ